MKHNIHQIDEEEAGLKIKKTPEGGLQPVEKPRKPSEIDSDLEERAQEDAYNREQERIKHVE